MPREIKMVATAALIAFVLAFACKANSADVVLEPVVKVDAYYTVQFKDKLGATQAFTIAVSPKPEGLDTLQDVLTLIENDTERSKADVVKDTTFVGVTKPGDWIIAAP